MKRHHRWPVFVCLVAVLAAAVAPVSGCRGRKASPEQAPGAGWFDDMRERIRDNFDNPGQVVALTGVVDQMEATMVELDRATLDYYAKIAALDRDYGATRGQFQALVDEFNASQRTTFEKMLVHAAELRRIAGPEGWKKISDIDKTIYESWQREL
jgi:hypothetical protein